MKKFFMFILFGMSSSLVFANSWIVELQDIDLNSAVREVSNITKKNFIVPDNLNTKITINIKSPVSSDDFYKYFLSALKLHNLMAVDDGSVIRIMRDVGGTEYIKLNYAKAEHVANIVNALSIDGFGVVPDVANNAILIKSKSSINAYDLISKLDTKRKQILIQAAIVEVSADDVNQLGIQWVLGQKNGYGVVNLNPKVSLSSVISNNPAFSTIGGLISSGKNDDNRFYGAVLQALDQTTNANLLSMPSVVAVENELASILVGQNVPFITGSYVKDNGREFQTIERQDIGINLRVVPQLSSDGVILKVYQEVSNVVNIQNQAGIVTNKNVVETTISTKPNQTVVIGGLIREDKVTDVQAVPGLSKIPLLGRAFKSEQDVLKKSNLLIFLQANVVNDESSEEPLIVDPSTGKVIKLVFEDGKVKRINQN